MKFRFYNFQFDYSDPDSFWQVQRVHPGLCTMWVRSIKNFKKNLKKYANHVAEIDVVGEQLDTVNLCLFTPQLPQLSLSLSLSPHPIFSPSSGMYSTSLSSLLTYTCTCAYLFFPLSSILHPPTIVTFIDRLIAKQSLYLIHPFPLILLQVSSSWLILTKHTIFASLWININL